MLGSALSFRTRRLSSGTYGSNPSPSSGESSANLTWGRIQPPCIWGARDAIPYSLHARGPDPQALGSVDNDDGLCPKPAYLQAPRIIAKRAFETEYCASLPGTAILRR
jgi:hypothetical protein